MSQYIKESYLLSKEEYIKLTEPDVTYALVSKSAANRMVKFLLIQTKFTCWLDDPENAYDDDCGVCSVCPVGEILGPDGYQLCLRQKSWSK